MRRSHLVDKLRDQLTDILFASFPPEERDDPRVLAAKVESGQAWLFTAHAGEGLVGFAVVMPLAVEGVLLLDYLAVAPGHRNRGVGSAFLGYLGEELRDAGADRGVLLEVESPDWGTGEERALRTRRIGFYRRHGIVPLPGLPSHRVPSAIGGPPLRNELLWWPFGGPAPEGVALRECLVSFYEMAYGVAEDAVLVQEALALVPG